MVNSQLVREQEIAFKVDRLVDRLPMAIPVVEVNPKLTKPLVTYNAVKTTTGALTTLTTPTDQDVYIRSVVLNMVKDATCDAATGQLYVSCMVGGLLRVLACIPILTLTAQSFETRVDFGSGIKVDRGSAIAGTSNAYTVGLMSKSVIVVYYLDEVA